MPREERRSFSASRKWAISLNVALGTLALAAIVVMINYLGARHFYRFPVSGKAQTTFSPLTRNVLASITNDVHVVLYFDKGEPIYDSVWSLLKEYTYASSRVVLEAVDPDRDKAASELLKQKYKLSNRNVVLFECKGQRQVVNESELSDVDANSMMSGKSKEIKRTHFKGELMFTSALMSVTTPRNLKAYFLQKHGEHDPRKEDKQTGYSRFADVLAENNINFDILNGLYGSSEIPEDCQLLIIAGPRDSLQQEELDKIERYLKQGGRLFVLFNFLSLDSPKRSTGLENLLSNWGVEVGRDVVIDRENSMTDGKDVVVSQFANHPLTRPLSQTRGIYMIEPRSFTASRPRGSAADAPQVEWLAQTGPHGQIVTDIRKNAEVYPNPSDYVGPVNLMMAVERYSLKGVKDRGSTRILALGDSWMFSNEAIQNFSNLDFASHALNWLLARNELLVSLAPRPIKEYKLNMTDSQRTAAGWILLAGMPGGVILIGSLVWLRRRS
ncbi:MAG TPA: GldG family protein [Candidatus Saccharimonadales bacterium]|nr:GldG family protein [Candidatus Saccharimonadales bacterium]